MIIFVAKNMNNYRETATVAEIKERIYKYVYTKRITFDEIYEVKYEERRVVMFQIPAAPQGLPIAYKGHYYGRDGESLVALNLHEIELIRAQANAREDWSAEVILGASIDYQQTSGTESGADCDLYSEQGIR